MPSKVSYFSYYSIFFLKVVNVEKAVFIIIATNIKMSQKYIYNHKVFNQQIFLKASFKNPRYEFTWKKVLHCNALLFFCKTLERKEIVSIINIRYLNYFNTLYLILDYAEMNATVHFMGWYREVCHE